MASKNEGKQKTGTNHLGELGSFKLGIRVGLGEQKEGEFPRNSKFEMDMGSSGQGTPQKCQ